MKEEIKERIAQIRRGELPDGYRRTKAGIMPGDWKIGQFGEVFQFIPNNAYSRALMTDSGGQIRNVHYGDVLIKYCSVIDCAANDLPFLINSEKIRQDMFLKSGDIIIADTAEDLTAGKAAEITNVGSQRVVSGLHTMACRPVKNQFAPKWLGYYMDSAAYHNQLIPLICGAKVSSISKGEIINTVIAIPPFAEQARIAGILSAQDSVIELKERLISEKLRQKQALMQRLLTGKQRLPGFSGEWRILQAKNVFRSVTDKNHNGDLEVLSATQDRGIIPRSQVDIDIKYDDSALPTYKRVKNGNFVISLRSFQGGIEYSEYEGLISPAYTVLENKIPIDAAYYKQYFKSARYIAQLQIAVYGIRDGKQISYEDFGFIEICYPPMNEQRAIADILSAADREIELLRASLEEEKRKKKALSQLLLTGIVRV